MHEPHSDLEQWKKYFTKAAFAGLCGIELIEAGRVFARTRLSVDNRHLNSWA
jgi:hypothetical protein